jgi:GNAT superfamily N-acetyltransferase
MAATPVSLPITTLNVPVVRTAESLQIVPVQSSHERERFLKLPWKIYRDDPAWVPPLLLERRAFINPKKHPFYQFGSAQLFLATLNGQDVGRIMVSDDPHYNEFHHSHVGCCGLFESVPDQQVANLLFTTASQWLAARGKTELRGPIDYSMNYACGLLVDGYETPPRLMMNHQPRYYVDLFERAGFEKAKDLFAWWFEPNQQLEQFRTRMAPLLDKYQVKLRPLDKKHWRREVQICKDIYHESWKDNWGFVPMTDAEFLTMTKEVIDWAQQDLLLVAEINGEPVGFSMTMPDLNEAMKPLDGKLFHWGLPLGYIQFCRNWHRIKTVRMLVLGVRREFRRRCVAEKLVLESFDRGRALGYTGAELSWTLDDNDLINRMIRCVGGQLYKTYRIYSRPITN